MIVGYKYIDREQLKQVFFTPQYPETPERGMGYIEIDKEVVARIGIQHVYKPIGYGGRMYVTKPDGTRFLAYCDNPRGYGGRNKRRFKVHSHGEVIDLTAQKKLTIDAVLYFVRSWAEPDGKVITPGKRTVNLNKQTAKTPCYVYFVLNRDSKAIKIGIAKNVRHRLASLQTSSPAQLQLIGSIKTASTQAARKLESELHHQFDLWQIRGEWFEANQAITDFITQNASG